MCRRAVLAIMFLLSISPAAFAAQGAAKKKKAAPEGTPVLWREPADIESRDLYNGPGGESMKPDLTSVTFIRDQMGGGFSTNYRVADGKGKMWVAKLSKEA